MATCYNTIFIALKRTRGYIVALEGSVEEYLFSHARQNDSRMYCLTEIQTIIELEKNNINNNNIMII